MSADSYWANVYALDAYPQATREESLRSCYRMLAKLYGVELGLLVAAETGECDDRCGSDGPRFQVGRVALCRRCAFRRSAAMRKAA